MSSHNSTHSEAAKMEQIITEFYAKSLHIILESRTPYMSSRNFSGEQILSSPSSSSSSSSSVRPRDKWFNLALRECPAALENLDLWRQSNSEPMVVDVVVVQRPAGWDTVNFSPRRELVRNLSSKERLYSYCSNSDQEEFGFEARGEMVVERWVLQYESRKASSSLNSGSRRSNTLSTLYRKSILMLRTLYSTVRLLPAYKVFRDLNSSGQIRSFTLSHRVSSFVESFTRKEEAEMQRFSFTPVETSCGRLCLSVVYRSSVSDLSSQPSTPISPRFIQDYVGSPLADPLRRFPSLPMSHGSPSSLPFSRRHSWSFDPHKASPPSFTPSPAYSEPRHYPPMHLPAQPPENLVPYKPNTSFEEYYPSPTFSPSPSPSPPIHIPAGGLSKSLFRSESAPVRIPIAKLANSSVSNKQSLPPSPPLKITRASIFKNEKASYPIQTRTSVEKFSFGKDDTIKFSGVWTSSNSSPQVSFSRSPSRSFPYDFDEPEFPCPFPVDMTDHGSSLPPSPPLKITRASIFKNEKASYPIQTRTSVEKFSFGKDDTIKFSGVQTSSNSSPQVSFSRSPSRSFPDDFDEPEFPCPFPVDMTDRGSRPESFDQLEPGGLFPIRKSQDAAFDALVHMLNKAPPPGQDFLGASKPETWIQEPHLSLAAQSTGSTSVTASGPVISKTTADALEELRGYKEMKNLLLRQGGRYSCTVAPGSTS